MDFNQVSVLALHLGLMALVGYFGIVGGMTVTDCLLAEGMIAGVAMPSSLGAKTTKVVTTTPEVPQA